VLAGVLHQQPLNHAGLGLARRIDAELDLLRVAVEHPLRGRSKAGLDDDVGSALAETNRILGVSSGHRREIERGLEPLQERARAIGVVLIDHAQTWLALLVGILPAESKAEEHR